jgi:excisionase family DNA binding protein
VNDRTDPSFQLIFSIPEVARRLGWTDLQTRRAVERGQLPARRWGRRVVVLCEDLEGHLRALPVREAAR